MFPGYQGSLSSGTDRSKPRKGDMPSTEVDPEALVRGSPGLFSSPLMLTWGSRRDPGIGFGLEADGELDASPCEHGGEERSPAEPLTLAWTHRKSCGSC